MAVRDWSRQRFATDPEGGPALLVLHFLEQQRRTQMYEGQEWLLYLQELRADEKISVTIL